MSTSLSDPCTGTNLLESPSHLEARNERTMFRVRSEERIESFSTAERILGFTLLLAIIASCGSIYLNFQERRRVGFWLEMFEPPSPASLELLSRQLTLQLIASAVVLVILFFCQMALRRLRRRYGLSQQSLRQVKLLAHDILASMDRGVVTSNCEGIITSINSAGIRLLGVEFDCVGTPVRTIASPEVPLTDICDTVIGSRSPVCDREVAIERNGRVSHLRVDSHVLHDSEKSVVGCVVHLHDVTERMLIEEQMRRMERFLSIAMLASGLHHEIKNPLTALSIHLQLLEEGLSSGDPETRVAECVGVIKTEVYRLNGVLESFRTFANLQQLVLQSTDVLEVVANVIRLIEPQAAQQQIRLRFARPHKELPRAQLDTDKFEQAVLNLVINALEAMPDGGQLTITVTDEGDTFRVVIEDSGAGIPPEVQRNLFRPYFSTKSKGSGIGLALSEKFISQHQGHITYRTDNNGTTFEIAIPFEQVDGNP